MMIDFRESESLMEQWCEANRLANDNWLRRRQVGCCFCTAWFISGTRTKFPCIELNV